MDVRLSSEQHALRDAAARIVDRHGVGAVGQLDDAERRAKLRDAIVESGWLELRTPDDDGSALASAVEAAIVAEELGRGLADAAYLGPTLAVELRRLAGAPPAAGPETVAMTSDLSRLAESGSTAGSRALAIDSDGAESALAVTSHGMTTSLVSLPVAPFNDPDAQVDLTRSCAAVHGGDLDGEATLDGGDVDGGDLDGDDLTRWTALALALTSADLVGVMRGAIDLSVDYAKERRQYGSPIGSFQAVQHLLADAFVAMEGSRSVALHAAWAVDALSPSEALAAGALAKAYAARSARNGSEIAVQVHGGIGNTWECLAHVYLRRALVSTDIAGGAGINLDRVLASRGVGADVRPVQQLQPTGAGHGLR